MFSCPNSSLALSSTLSSPLCGRRLAKTDGDGDEEEGYLSASTRFQNSVWKKKGGEKSGEAVFDVTHRVSA